MPAPDVGDQGPAQTSGGQTPAAWQPEQPEALMQEVMGIKMGQGQPGASGPSAPSQPPQAAPSAAPAQLTPQEPSMSDVMYMLKRLAGEVSAIHDAMAKPRQIQVKREKGKIVGATVEH